MRQVALPHQHPHHPQPHPHPHPLTHHPDPSLNEFASAPILSLPVLRRSSIILPSHNRLLHANTSSSTSTSSSPPHDTAVQPPPAEPHPPHSPHLPPSAAPPATAAAAAAQPPQTAKKPRAWALFRRSASTLAAAFTTDRAASPSPRIASQAEFRRTFLRLNRHRLLRDDAGTSFRLHPVIMNGDCGFASIAKGINFARQQMPPQSSNQPHAKQQQQHHHHHQQHHRHKNSPQKRSSGRAHSRRRPISLPRLWRRQSSSQHAHHKRTLHAKDIRNAMFHEIRKAKKTYLSDRHTLGALFSDHDFDRLERDVGTPGITGHWLGSVLGVLEHVIIAHAMNVNIFLYQFDLQRQCVRQFERATVSDADCDVFLFFTGPATGGHFDTLVKIPGEQVMFRA